MKFINRTGNTVYIQEIDRYVPYQYERPQYIDSDDILKSRGFQTLVLMGKFEAIEFGDSRIERNLERVNRGMSKIRLSTPKKESLQEDGEVAEDLEVCIKGHFLEGGGYAKVNRNLAFGLSRIGVNVKVDVIGGHRADMSDPDLKKIKSMQSKPSRNAIRIDSVVPTLSSVSSGQKSILYTTVESYSVPKQFIEVASMYSEVWVTSDFCKTVLVDAGVNRPIFVLPDSVDTDLYNAKGDTYEFRPSLNKFKFISVFGWSYRKGYDVLLKAYLQEFSGSEPVSLLVISKFQNNSRRSDVIKTAIGGYIKDYGGKNPPHIARSSRTIPEEEMPTLYRACDAFVLPTRGEGFCTFPHSMIRAKKGPIRIDDIQTGDLVFTHRGLLERVSHTFRRKYSGPMVEISCDGRSNQKLTVTPNHRVRVVRLGGLSPKTRRKFKDNVSYDWSKDLLDIDLPNHHRSKIHDIKIEWVEAGSLTKGDYAVFPPLCDDPWQLLRIRNTSLSEYQGDVCNIGVEGDNSYICENVAVHNCLPYCEASLCDLPVIGTRCSGQTMFLNDENSYLIDIDRLAKMPQGMMHIHYWDGQMFPSLTHETVVNDLRHQMRAVYENTVAAKRKNRKLKKFVRSNYSIDAVANMAKNRLEEIWRDK